MPGDSIATQDRSLRGHGTHQTDGGLVASVNGTLRTINQLVKVIPLHSRLVADSFLHMSIIKESILLQFM
jgi:exosome complex RNA-binding protein Rrp4